MTGALLSRLGKSLLLVVACGLHIGTPAAKPVQRYGVFVYSNECISDMSSDLGGNRITIWRVGGEDRLVYEFSDGASHALLGYSLKLDDTTREIGFTVAPAGETETRFNAKLSADGATLTVKGELYGDPARLHTLKRITDFSRPIPFCK